MNKIINRIFSFFVLAIIIVACDTEIENIPLQEPVVRDAQYYENLRAYKNQSINWLLDGSEVGKQPGHLR